MNVAWFTTQQSATVSYGNLTVSTVSSLTVSVKEIGFTVDDDFSTPASSYEDLSTEMGLVSTTDGKEFVAPSTLHPEDDYTEEDMVHITDSEHRPSGNKYVGYLKYLVHVEYLQDSVGTNMNLRWKIEMQNVDAALANVWRVGFFKASSTGFGDNIGLYSALGGTQSNTFGWENSAVVSGGSYATTTLPGSPTELGKDATTYVNTQDGIDEYYGVSIWFEGTDAAATNALGGKKLSSLLTFDLKTGTKTHA